MTRSEINKVEGIQKRATKMVIELRGSEYEDLGAWANRSGN